MKLKILHLLLLFQMIGSSYCQQYITLFDTSFVKLKCLEIQDSVSLETLKDSFRLENKSYYVCISNHCVDMDNRYILENGTYNVYGYSFFFERNRFISSKPELFYLLIDSLSDGLWYKIKYKDGVIIVITKKEIRDNLLVNHAITYFETGEIRYISSVKNGRLDSFCISYYKPGCLNFNCFFKDGKIVYIIKYFFDDCNKIESIDLNNIRYTWNKKGVLIEEASFSDGLPDGRFVFYDNNGKKIKEEYYYKGNIIATINY